MMRKSDAAFWGFTINYKDRVILVSYSLKAQFNILIHNLMFNVFGTEKIEHIFAFNTNKLSYQFHLSHLLASTMQYEKIDCS